MKANVIPGAVVRISSPTQGDWTGTFGSATIGRDDPPSVEDHFRAGSITKTMTSTVILQLMQEGRLSLDDPIGKFRRGVPNGDRITIAELAEMRSGLYSYTFDPTFNETLDADPGKAWTPDELLAIAFSHPVDAQPGMTRLLPAQARPFTAGIAAPSLGGRADHLPQSGRRCCSTYWRMIASGAPPQEAAKYDGDHRWSRCVRNRNRCRSRRDETPLRLFTSLDSCTVGGYSTSRCTWSSPPLNSTRAAPKSAHTSARTGCIAVRCASVNTPRRYFVTKTKWTCRANTHDLPRRTFGQFACHDALHAVGAQGQPGACRHAQPGDDQRLHADCRDGAHRPVRRGLGADRAGISSPPTV